MKKLLLLLSGLVILGLPKLTAQIINPDFETWSDNFLVGYPVKDPNSGNGSNGWWDFNMMNNSLLGSSPITVFQDSANPSPEHGTYYAKIVSDTMSPSSYNLVQSYGFPYPRTNGLIITGYVHYSFPNLSIKYGIPCSNEIQSLSFWYRYIPSGGTGNDTCSCTIAMSHYNHHTGQRDVVGGGYWSNSSTVSSWTRATVNISYVPDSTLVDTIYVAFSACALHTADNPKMADTMDIDSVTVRQSGLGISNITKEQDKVVVYPNPAENEITISASGQFQAARAEVYDITGKSVGTYIIHNNFLTVNTQSYNNGLYFYKLFDNTGNQMNVGKFSVVK